MFDVYVVSLGKVFTVYNVNGTHFVIYKDGAYIYLDMNDCIPVKECDWLCPKNDT